MKRAEVVKHELAADITKAIAKNNMTQQRVAEIIGVTQGRVSNLVTGRVDLFSLDNLVNIAAKLGLTLTVKTTYKEPKRSYTGKPVRVR